MATSFQTYIDRENIENSVLKTNVSKTATGQRGLATKTLHAPTPRKALGDVGNIQHGTGKKFQTPKPSKVKIFDETPKARTSIKSKKGTFSVLKTNKVNNVSSRDKTKTRTENMMPEIEKMTPFVDKENDIPRPQHITKLLNHNGLLNPFLLLPPTAYEDVIKLPLSQLELDPLEPPCFNENVANIIGYDEQPELVDVDPHFALLDLLPPLDDIDLTFMS